MADFESMLREYISENEKVLAEVHFRKSKLTFQFPVRNIPTTSPFFVFFTVTDVGFYATNKRLIRVEFETMPDFRELPYSAIEEIVPVKEKKLFRRREYYQIEGNLSNEERRLWRIPANAKNAEEFYRVVEEMIRRRRE